MATEEEKEKAIQLLKDARALLEESKKLEPGINLKQELQDFLSDSDNEHETEDIGKISNALSKIKLSQITKLRKFSKGENFSRFCERFQEYVYITNMRDVNLYMFFLQNVDDETYSVLKTARLTTEKKADASLFCEVYRNAIYGDESLSLKNEVMDCTQKSGETVSDYAYRLREKANIAYSDPDMGEDNCLLTFLRGVRDPSIKRKLNEAPLSDFSEAIKLAKKLERVENMLNTKPEVEINSILKESAVSFRPSSERSRDLASPSGNRERSRSENSCRSNSDIESNDRYDNTSYSRGRNDRNRRRSYSNERYGRDDRPQRYGYHSDRCSNYRGNRRHSDRGGYNGAFNSRSSKICWACSKRGHIRSQCWSRRPRNNGYQSQRGHSSWNQGPNYRQNPNQGPIYNHYQEQWHPAATYNNSSDYVGNTSNSNLN